jgi:hypothetical protein
MLEHPHISITWRLDSGRSKTAAAPKTIAAMECPWCLLGRGVK